MNRILQTGRTGPDSIQSKMDTIAHNIANVRTDGYKAMEVQFGDLVYDLVDNRGTPMTPEARTKPIEIGTGSRVKSIVHRFEQGTPQETKKPLDLAIQGEGFFGVEGENGEVLLTRDGAFTLDGGGTLVDESGRPVRMDVFSPLSRWSAGDIHIDENGLLTGSGANGQIVNIGRIRLYDVPDKSTLHAVGNNLFAAERQEDIYDTADRPGERGSIKQGFLEGSTVDIAQELTDMLVTQRAYSINTKSIQAADDLWGMVNQLRR